MSAERDSIVNLYRAGTLEFVRWSTERGVANYVLAEEAPDVLTRLWGFFGIYPKLPLGTRTAYMAFVTEKDRVLDVRKALQLQIPERVKKIKIQINPRFSRDMELVLAASFMPSKVLAFGEKIQSGEEVAVFFCLGGERPEKALQEIQQRIREFQAKQN